MTPTEALNLLLQARQETISKKTYVYWQPIDSIEKQINYLIEAVNHQNDRSRLKDIVIGIYAVREFKGIDDRYADLLYKIADISKRMEEEEL